MLIAALPDCWSCCELWLFFILLLGAVTSRPGRAIPLMHSSFSRSCRQRSSAISISHSLRCSIIVFIICVKSYTSDCGCQGLFLCGHSVSDMEREANEMGLHSASFFGRELPPSQRRRHLLIPSGIFGDRTVRV